MTNYYMTRAGLPPPPQTDPRLARLLALATQKFIADVAADAYQYSRIRASNTSANNPMGNLGAAACVWQIGFLAEERAWTVVFAISAVSLVLCGLCWLGVDPNVRLARRTVT